MPKKPRLRIEKRPPFRMQPLPKDPFGILFPGESKPPKKRKKRPIKKGPKKK
jgi:hypothetical protein